MTGGQNGLQGADLIFGQQLCPVVVDLELAGNGVGHGLTVASEHCRLNPGLVQGLDSLGGVGSQLVGNQNPTAVFAVDGQVSNGAIHHANIVGNRLLVQQTVVAS